MTLSIDLSIIANRLTYKTFGFFRTLYGFGYLAGRMFKTFIGFITYLSYNNVQHYFSYKLNVNQIHYR